MQSGDPMKGPGGDFKSGCAPEEVWGAMLKICAIVLAEP